MGCAVGESEFLYWSKCRFVVSEAKDDTGVTVALGLLSHIWETRMEFPASWLWPGPNLTIVAIWGVNRQMEHLPQCVCVSLSLSNNQITK